MPLTGPDARERNLAAVRKFKETHPDDWKALLKRGREKALKKQIAAGLCQYSRCPSLPKERRKFCEKHLAHINALHEKQRRAKGIAPRNFKNGKTDTA